MKHDRLRVQPGSKICLKDYDPADIGTHHERETAEVDLQTGVQLLGKYQDILYAQNTSALLIIFQAMDAAGKDSTIKHVMSGVNPQGCQVFNFKAPSLEELNHDYLWRSLKVLPERGRIGIFNRSYYEEVLIVRVHPDILERQKLPVGIDVKNIWHRRFTEINNLEKYLVDNGITVLKFFLNMSKAKQKQRFLERIDQPEKNWKFSIADVQERVFWDDYRVAYEDMLNHTSTESAPWYIIPADYKWFTRLAVVDIICDRLKLLNLQYPTVSAAHREALLKAKAALENEDS
jgi:PPK2 family polyphosphate:nucleotide phosphotransferase